ncbi:hypothetical protein cce_0406 [Crocosphaera subtropica ATCC 51142]|uniref:Uncharacterized protein n=1 Tax=Crocosphaera subtropica (strain ATCC 51142 / BH68) TaxID=43989 RepID=B1WNB5_CROS5|nr:hypothetical protein [Crocosphaera subtropica]ACB49757.1 hypothetical protein cce_0406 [Crocosphaera subtropica ATCC 51142]
MSKKLIFQGTTTYVSEHWYAKVIFPLVEVKKLLQTIYEFLLHLIWSELIYGKKLDNELDSLVAFFIFCLLSLLGYYFRDYVQIIIIVFFIIWYLDCWFAKHQYFQKNSKIDIYLYEIDKNKIIGCLSLPKTTTQSVFASFSLEEVNYISIIKLPLLGGTFQEILDEVWQTEIYLYNGKHFVVDENLFPHESLVTAKKLANYFKADIIFAHSQGKHSYVEQELNPIFLSHLFNQNSGGVRYQKNSRKIHIYTQWQWSNSWNFLKRLFEKAGFFVFIIIMSGFMIKWGGLLNNIILVIRGKDDIIYLSSPLQWLIPNWHWRNILEFVVVLGVFIYQGWQLSRVKHIYITKYYLKFFIDNKMINKIKTSDIKISFVINNSYPEILIIGENKVVNITKFQQENIAQIFWSYLDEALKTFQQQQPKRLDNQVPEEKD